MGEADVDCGLEWHWSFGLEEKRPNRGSLGVGANCSCKGPQTQISLIYLLTGLSLIIGGCVCCPIFMAGSIIQGTSEPRCYMNLRPCASFVFHVPVKALLTQTDPVSGILKSYAGAKRQEATKLSSSLQHVAVFSVMSSLKVKVTFLLLAYFSRR